MMSDINNARNALQNAENSVRHLITRDAVFANILIAQAWANIYRADRGN